MPIYEFYCPDCHTLYSFFARRVDTQTVPACPKSAQHGLQRQMSRFAISTGRQAASGEAGAGEGDAQEAQMEQAMLQLASEMEHVSEDDPRALARMMRKMVETSGMNMGEGMEEAIRRLETGEDPEQVEEQLGDVLDGAFDGLDGLPAESGEGSPIAGGSGLRKVARRLRGAARVDPEIYDM